MIWVQIRIRASQIMQVKPAAGAGTPLWNARTKQGCRVDIPVRVRAANYGVVPVKLKQQQEEHFFLRLSSEYNYNICLYTHARTNLYIHTTLRPPVYNQIYNYTQIRRPYFSRDHQKPSRLRRRRIHRSLLVAPWMHERQWKFYSGRTPVRARVTILRIQLAPAARPPAVLATRALPGSRSSRSLGQSGVG
jgi:hypothetical protein